jgi:hypothetical protein
MKKLVGAMVITATLVLAAGGARAVEGISDTYDDDMMHPLQIAYYLAHPIGYAAEWLVGRPFHYLISRPYLDSFFGYEHFDEERTYFAGN